jgi:TonB family protein
MKLVLVLALLCGAMAATALPRPCVAAFGQGEGLKSDVVEVRNSRRHAPHKRIAAPARPSLTEEEALHSLETEISRKIGLQMKEADYPEEARRWTWSGTTLVHVLIGADGLMSQISVGRTSGFRMLDEQAVRVVSRIRAPSWIPDRLRGRAVSVLVPIGFILGRDE